MDAEQRWPRGLLRDLDSLSVDRHDGGRRSYSRPRVYRRQAPQDGRPNGGRRAQHNAQHNHERQDHTTHHNPHAHEEVFVPKKSLILCFDGTGNKFQGSAGDSNILKIYSMLDKEDPHVFRYYQPGIGTYVESSSLSKKSRVGRIKSWYKKAKDQAVGTSFGEHVMAGYKFLMRYYSAGDDIYFFGFSRGAYTARFLAQMLDYIGLLSTGNEEMLRFAWKTFSRWQMRTEGSEKEKEAKHETFRYMEQFRETFSRPIDSIRFVGLFDCVNSVPQFEAAWMKRSRFPYTARMSADVIRHAVAIDERRAKFRQDLISEPPPKNPRHKHLDDYMQWLHLTKMRNKAEGEDEKPSAQRPHAKRNDSSQARFRPRKPPHRHGRPASSAGSRSSMESSAPVRERLDGYEKPLPRRTDEQDISEVWFAGEHADIGGGWWLLDDEIRPASDLPLIWMLREAKRAGMPLDEAKLARAQYHAGEMGLGTDETYRTDGKSVGLDGTVSMSDIEHLATQTRLHDSLTFSGGLPWTSVIPWLIMEHLPFRRMDLQEDGSWKPISWPLPRGETRDMPDDAQVHSSVIQRMKADPNYRPGNLIIGGGGRGVRRAPQSAGTGKWRVVRERGDPIGESVVRVVRKTTGLDF
ncbi:hypothetical protein Q7P37_000905 [Cladosporium fusiforme]